MQSAIEVRALAQRARSGAVTLQDVSLTVGSGELVAIIGASGSGKTTLLDTMCGLRSPAAGAVSLVSRNVGYVPQDDIIHLALPLARTLRYAAALRGVPGGAVDVALRTLELAGRSLVPVGELSGGERKRASIASELLAEPTLFFLDEPTSGLDPARGAELMRALRALTRAGTTVVLTTHTPADAERCDKVAVLAPEGASRSSARPPKRATTSAPPPWTRSTSCLTGPTIPGRRSNQGQRKEASSERVRLTPRPQPVPAPGPGRTRGSVARSGSGSCLPGGTLTS